MPGTANDAPALKRADIGAGVFVLLEIAKWLVYRGRSPAGSPAQG